MKRNKLDQTDFRLYFFDNELELIVAFFDTVYKYDPDFIEGWNSSAFDLAYIHRRLEVLGVDPAEVMSDPNYSIEDFDIDYVNRYLTDVKVNTTYDDLKNKITLASGYSVEIDYIEKNGKKLLYTGGKVKIMNGSTVYKEFSIVVIGDTTGDGEINSADLLRIRQHLLGSKPIN